MADKHKVTDCGILRLGNGRQTQSHMLWNLTFRKWPTNTKSLTRESYFSKMADKHKVTDYGILLLENGRQTQSHR